MITLPDNQTPQTPAGGTDSVVPPVGTPPTTEEPVVTPPPLENPVEPQTEVPQEPPTGGGDTGASGPPPQTAA